MLTALGRVGVAVMLWAAMCQDTVSERAAGSTDLGMDGLLEHSTVVNSQASKVLARQRVQGAGLQLQHQGSGSAQLSLPAAKAAAPAVRSQGGWMGQCCSHKRLQELYMPGTHDSGTGYPWTVPRHLPLVVDEVAAVLFNIVGDLSRTQHLTVYEQLRAGARVLDIRLAVNPWIPLQQRMQQPSNTTTTSTSSSSSSLGRRSRGSTAQQRVPGSSSAGPPEARRLARVFRLTPQLQGRLDYAAAGGPLSAAELSSAVVISHSLPGAPLAGVLADVARFLQEQPSEVVAILVKGDTVDVNVAAIQRMSAQAWAAAAGIFRRELAGVQLLQQHQVEQQTLGEIAAAAPRGSVLLYGRELLQAGLPCLLQPRLLESWANGTNTEELPELKTRLLQWLQFWHRDSNQGASYMLLASAEVTLGVRTILQLLRRRLWETQQQQQQQQQEHLFGSAGSHLQQQHGRMDQQQQRQQQARALQRAYAELQRLGAVRTLYGLGQQTNAELLRDILQDSRVPKSFNVWSLDALADSDIIDSIISLNRPPA